MSYFLGVDVGTESVRVGLFNSNGKLIDFKVEPIHIYNFKPDFYEQSSDNIWHSIQKCIKTIIENCNSKHAIKISDIVSIGFDATCSLVILDEQFKPVTVSLSNNELINVIMWMDHRSKQQADFINSTKHSVLKSAGGSINVEMDPPKILWLKQNLNESFTKAAHFFSLPDYLVWRMSNTNIRSICCTVCKWLYQSNETSKSWDSSFWNTIGLEELVLNDYNRIGSNVKKPFSFIKELKVSAETAKELGLSPDLRVGISMIDAHAGGVGGLSVTMGFLQNLKEPNLNLEKYSLNKCEIEDILVLVSGTSSCLMASSKSSQFVNGIWGPYYEAMAPFFWLNEAGQSASGKLIDHLVKNHPAFIDYKDNGSIFDKLNDILLEKVVKQGLNLNNISILAKDIHIYPDFHGNRSPLADTNMVGAICGLTFDISLENLAITYLACLQSLAYQIKQIITKMNLHNIHFKVINIIGGLAKNTLYCHLISDICSLPVVVSESDATVLLGSAVSGASNYYEHGQFNDLLKQFSGHGALNSRLVMPNNLLEKFHECKYKVFLKMIDDQMFYRDLMSSF